MLRQIAAVEAHGLVRIVAVVVVPVEQRARRSRSQRQHVHAEHAAHIHLARARQQRIAHHAHDRARHDAEILFQRRPALHRTDRARPLSSSTHPSTAPSFAIFSSAACGIPARRNVFLNRSSASPTAAGSSSFIREMRPITSDRSSVSTEIPLCSRIFSL